MMHRPVRPGPATKQQTDRLRELAVWPGLPQPASKDYVEKRIAEGLNVNEADALIGSYGVRIKALGPVEAMVAEAKRLGEP